MKVLHNSLAYRYMSAKALKAKGYKIRLIKGCLIATLSMLFIICALHTPAQAQAPNGTIPQDNKLYLPMIANVGQVGEAVTITDTDNITVNFDTLYVNTTVTKTVKSALNYINMTDTKTMIGVTPLDMELGDLPHGTIKANAYSYTYHTATKDLACAQIKVAFQVAEGKARNVIGKACYKTLFSEDPNVQYHDLYLAVNDQAELLAHN